MVLTKLDEWGAIQIIPISHYNMADFNLIVDIPSCLLFEIWSKWLGGVDQHRRRSTMRLDSALCNKQARFSLLDLYAQVHWEKFLIDCQPYQTGRKMKWMVGRVKISNLQLVGFPNDSQIVKTFFRWNAQSLRVIKLTDSDDAMTGLTKAIATECKVLLTLCLERCNLTVPIATILNKTTTITELRLQSRLHERGYARATLPVTLLNRIRCPKVTKLALLDTVSDGCASTILTAFPNVEDVEFSDIAPAALQTLLTSGTIHTLQLHASEHLRSNVFSSAEAIGAAKREHLRTLVLTFEPTRMPFISVQRLLSACANLTALTLWTKHYLFQEDVVTLVAEHCQERLQVLRVSGCPLTPASIATLAERCPNLTVLNIAITYIMRKSSDTLAVVRVCEAFLPLFRRCGQLERLRLRGLRMEEMDGMIAAIAAHCSALQVLSFGTRLYGVYGVPVGQKVALQKLRGCRALRRVEMEMESGFQFDRSKLVGSKIEVVAWLNTEMSECYF